MSPAELRQEVSENRNTIYQLRKGEEPNKRQRQNNWQAGRRDQDPQPAEQPAPRTGVRVPEGAAKGAKGPQKSPVKAQANMLKTSRRTFDSDEDLMYERAFLVGACEDIDKKGGPVEPSMVHEVDSPFSMDQIRTSIMDTGPARERANLVRIRMEPKAQVIYPGRT